MRAAWSRALGSEIRWSVMILLAKVYIQCRVTFVSPVILAETTADREGERSGGG